MSNDPYIGYVGHPLKTVLSGLAVIFPGTTIESYPEGTNVSGAVKAKRLRVFYVESTKIVSRVVSG